MRFQPCHAVLAALFLACSSVSEVGTTSGSGSGSSGGASGTTGGSSGGTSGGTSGTTGGDTWVSWASPDFFQTYCTSCHSAGGEGDPSGTNLDWTNLSDVRANGNTIRCGVAIAQDPSWNCPGSVVAKQFPIGTGPHPAEAERERLVSWIDAGMP